jgi:hypothetical protein
VGSRRVVHRPSLSVCLYVSPCPYGAIWSSNKRNWRVMNGMEVREDKGPTPSRAISGNPEAMNLMHLD